MVLVLTGLTWFALVRVAPGSVHQAQGQGVQLLLADRHLPIVLEHSYFHMLLPAGEHRLRWASGVQPLASRRQTLLSDRLSVEYGTHTEMLVQPFGASEIQLQLVRLLKLPAPVAVSWRDGRYTLRNPFPYPLYQVQIRRAPGRGVQKGTFELSRSVAAGATLAVAPRRVPSVYGVLPREGEWLTAILNDVPSPMQFPLTFQKESATLWVRIQ